MSRKCELCHKPTPLDRLYSVGQYFCYVCEECVAPMRRSNQQMKKLRRRRNAPERPIISGRRICAREMLWKRRTWKLGKNQALYKVKCLSSTLTGALIFGDLLIKSRVSGEKHVLRISYSDTAPLYPHMSLITLTEESVRRFFVVRMVKGDLSRYHFDIKIFHYERPAGHRDSPGSLPRLVYEASNIQFEPIENNMANALRSSCNKFKLYSVRIKWIWALSNTRYRR